MKKNIYILISITFLILLIFSYTYLKKFLYEDLKDDYFNVSVFISEDDDYTYTKNFKNETEEFFLGNIVPLELNNYSYQDIYGIPIKIEFSNPFVKVNIKITTEAGTLFYEDKEIIIHNQEIDVDSPATIYYEPNNVGVEFYEDNIKIIATKLFKKVSEEEIIIKQEDNKLTVKLKKQD